MRVPKILYHGTTALRWNFIKKQGLLRSDTKNSGWNTGYVYFTPDPNQAVSFGLLKSLIDMDDLDYNKLKEYPNFRDVVVIGIDVSKLGKLETDPETFAQFNKAIWNGIVMNTKLYRYKGDIKLDDLSLYKSRSFNSFSNEIINKINKTKKDIDNYREVCRTLIKEKQKLNRSSSFLEVLGFMDKVRSVSRGIGIN